MRLKIIQNLNAPETAVVPVERGLHLTIRAQTLLLRRVYGLRAHGDGLGWAGVRRASRSHQTRSFRNELGVGSLAAGRRQVQALKFEPALA